MGDTGIFHTEEIGASLRAAQVLGLTSTAFFCGKTFSQSFSTTPALLLAPAPLLAKQWKKMFDSDKLMAPILVAFSVPIFSILAYREPRFSNPSNLYAASASLLALCVPYTYLFAEPINQKLEAKASSFANAAVTEAGAEVGVRQEETVHYLVDRWATVNLGRTLLTGISALLATWAAVERIKIGRFRIVSGAERMGK